MEVDFMKKIGEDEVKMTAYEISVNLIEKIEEKE